VWVPPWPALAAADRFPVVGIILLVAAFALMLATMLHFARRLTQDVVRPVETLQAATDRLNEMARALSESDARRSHAGPLSPAIGHSSI
jgi:hypothetical protein